MKLSLIGVSLFVAAGFVACAEAAENDSDPAAKRDAAGLPPGREEPSATPDASPEAGDATAPVRVCSDHGFCHVQLPAGEHELRGVWGDGAGAVWAVSAQGNVLRWSGTAWKVHASGLGALSAVWGSGPTDVWIGGDGGLQHGTGPVSAALPFAPSALPGGGLRVTSIWGTGPSDVWVVGAGENDAGESETRAMRYDGASWAIVTVPADLKVMRVWGSVATGVWMAGLRPIPDEWFEEVVVLRRAPGANDFAEVTLPTDPDDTSIFSKMGSIQGAAATSSTSMWILGRSLSSIPGLWQGTSADGGQTFTWTYTRDGRHDDPELRAVFGTAANDAWAVGDYGRVRRWDGVAWRASGITLTQLPVTDPFYAVWSAGPEETWIVGDGITLRYDPLSKDGGK